jgi:hypothetical protein
LSSAERSIRPRRKCIHASISSVSKRVKFREPPGKCRVRARLSKSLVKESVRRSLVSEWVSRARGVSAPVSFGLIPLLWPLTAWGRSSSLEDAVSARNEGEAGGSDDRVKKTTFARDPPI